MSKFSKYLSRVITLSNSFTNANKDAFEEMFQSFDALEEELKKSKSRAWDKSQKDKPTVTHLTSINEDDTESPTHMPQEDKVKQLSNGDSTSNEGHNGRRSKKRSKHEVEGMESPEQEKRQKRNASVKAQSIISKQVNLNLNEKLRRDKSPERGRRRRGKEDDKENAEPLPVVKVKQEKISIPPEPEPKSESKPEPMEVLSVDVIKQVVKQEASKDDVAMPPPAAPGPKSRRGVQKEKSEESTDDETPGASRRGRRTRKQTDTLPAAQTVRPSRAERASARVTKQTDGQTEEPTTTTPPPSADTRPKRTRAKKVTQTTNSDAEKETQVPVENGTASPAEKPRPKRTRRAAKAAEKEAEKLPEPTQPVSEPTQPVSEPTQPISEPNQPVTKPEFMSPKEERVSSLVQQPIKQKQTNAEKTKLQETKQNSRDKETNETPIENVIKNLNNNYHSTEVEKILTKNSKNVNKNYEHCEIIENKKVLETRAKINDKIKMKNVKDVDTQNKINSNLQEMKETNSNLKEINSNLRETVVIDETDNIRFDKAKVSSEMDTSVVVSKDLDRTMVLPNGVYNHAPITPVPVRAMNATVVLEHCRETMVLDEPRRALMDATVVLDKDAKAVNVTDDNSLLTDDSDTVETETPQKKPPVVQPLSAVKEKVQQFEEMASRQTRTKTRAMAKKEENQDEQTPPDKVSKVILTNETLDKMNSMIFNGKPPLGQAGKGGGRRVESATKPRAHTPVNQSSLVSSSASKLSGINKAREADELRREREDARKKKEALLEAKREAQRKKREEKMAAAAAAREAAERERRAAMEAAVRERMEKQAHADQGKLERLKEVEKKKLETARKVAETEERRRAEEQARQQRLEEELRRADAARKKQLEEAEASRKEAAIMQKEIERRQKELMEKRKMKQRMEGDKTPLKTGSPRVMDPVHMEDGFQYLNSDSEDEEAPAPPVPDWCASKTRRVLQCVQQFVRVAEVDVLFSVRAQTPDLSDIFPNIERARLKRTSSAVWRVSPARAALSPLAE